jgi:MarR family transcriptional regulator, transcriptional regulator for hemolysin
MSKPYALHDSLGYQLTLLSRINERRFEALLAPLGLTRVKWCVLLAVGQEGHQNPSDIAAFIGIDRTATSRALRALEADGQIARIDGTQDKRTTEVSLTDQGRATLAQANAAATENAERINAKLSWYQQKTLVEIIEALMQGETRSVSGL